MKRAKRWLALLVLSVAIGPAPAAEVSSDESHTELSIAGLSSSPGDDEPRVLHILPWQPPSIPRRPRSELNAESPGLLDPIDPVVFERHRRFRQTLDPALESRFTLH